MPDLNKDEYVYLMIVQTQNADKHILDTNVVPFKSMADVKHALLNVIANNIKNYKNDIVYISYDNIDTCTLDTFAYSRIEYKNGIYKTYDGIRRKIQEVK